MNCFHRDYRHCCSLAALVFLVLVALPCAGADSRYFAIHVVDAQDGRGVPMVELKTIGNVRYYTDSAGYVAIDDPVLMGQRAFFFLNSDGYQFPSDGFGMRGKTLDVKAGTTVTLQIKRLNIAQRIYRLTGEGIYRDSVMLGLPVPIRQPLLNAQVSGQDSTLAVIYRGKIHWFWGDTMRPSYPLGHFGTSGAISDIPGKGGLDPSVGVNLQYFVDKEGFSRPTLDGPQGMLRWIDGVMTIGSGDDEKLIGEESDKKDLANDRARKLVIWNDKTEKFDVLADLPLSFRNYPNGHPIRVTVDGVDYFYFGSGYPNLRCKADLKSIEDLASYEAFTCLEPGSQADGEHSKIERAADGSAVWGWKKNTDPLVANDLLTLFNHGTLKASELQYVPLDADSGKPVALQAGGASYNAYRKKWVQIAVQIGGSSSFLGEIWYTEADHPEGPWLAARKIVTQDKYSLYNPVQHPFFEEDGGRMIYFDGTYATTFSRYGDPTPRYDYNILMFKLDLSDPRLVSMAVTTVPASNDKK
jgi:hypothetical protein